MIACILFAVSTLVHVQICLPILPYISLLNCATTLMFQGDLGYLYLDLYSRKGKYPGCAHFAIKGGRRISETDYQLPVRKSILFL
jgi:hypothetical protein